MRDIKKAENLVRDYMSTDGAVLPSGNKYIWVYKKLSNFKGRVMYYDSDTSLSNLLERMGPAYLINGCWQIVFDKDTKEVLFSGGKCDGCEYCYL